MGDTAMSRATAQKARTVQVVRTYKKGDASIDLIGPEIRDAKGVAALTDGAKIVRPFGWYGSFTHLVTLRDGREALVEMS